MTIKHSASDPCIPSDAIFAISRRGGASPGASTKLTASVSVVQGGTKGVRKDQVMINIPETWMRQARWMIGDRVDVLMSNKLRELWIRRSKDGNYLLSLRGNSTKEEREAKQGKMLSASTKFTRPEDWLMSCGDRFNNITPEVRGEWLVLRLVTA
jgi:hypothetical protein